MTENNVLNLLPSIIVGLLGVIVTGAIYKFNMYSWKQSNRPFVTARISPIEWASPALRLVLTNTGNRPAKDVKLSLSRKEDLLESFLPNPDAEMKRFAESCFQNEIPIIANGKELEASFGSFVSVWKNEGPSGRKIGIKIEYKDVEDGRTFYHYQDIRLIRVDSFADGIYKKPPISVVIENLPEIDV